MLYLFNSVLKCEKRLFGFILQYNFDVLLKYAIKVKLKFFEVLLKSTAVPVKPKFCSHRETWL